MPTQEVTSPIALDETLQDTNGKLNTQNGKLDSIITKLQGIIDALGLDPSIYKPAGTKTCAELVSSLLIASNLGNVYNITDSGTTTADFVEGAGKPINAGANVAIVDIGTGGTSVYKFDLLAGIIDLSDYVQKSETVGLLKNDGSVDETDYATSAELEAVADDVEDIQDSLDTDTTSISGNPISITGLKSSQLAVNPVITYNPIQDLHGQSKPYPAGGGKNKLPMTVQSIKDANTSGTWSGNAYTYNDVTFTILTDSADNVTGINVNSSQGASSTTAFFVTKNYTNANSLILNGCPSGGATNTYRLDAGTDATSDVGSGKSISGGLSGVNIRIVIFSGVTMSNKVFYPMIRLSTESDSSFAPYSNICPISGYDKIEVLSCGVNLFDEVIETGKLDDSTGQNTPASDRYRCKNYIPVVPNTAYTFGKNGTAQEINVFFYDTDKTFISYDGYESGFTTPNNAYYIRFYAGTVINVSTGLQLEEGSSATTYVPYHKTTDLSESLGQTVYWGEYDVRTGKFKVIGQIIDMGDITWSYDSGYSRFLTTDLSSVIVKPATARTQQLWFSCYECVTDGRSMAEVTNGQAYSGATGAVYVHDNRYTDGATFKTAMAGQKIVYPLATPFTIQLTPHEIALSQDYAYLSTNGSLIELAYHNGEVATHADVEQLAETYNRFADGITFTKYTVVANAVSGDGNNYQSFVMPHGGLAIVRGNNTVANLGVRLLGSVAFYGQQNSVNSWCIPVKTGVVIETRMTSTTITVIA